MSEVIIYQAHEFRSQGMEIHRRPLHRDGLNTWQASWEALCRGRDYIPDPVQDHFRQARDRAID